MVSLLHLHSSRRQVFTAALNKCSYNSVWCGGGGVCVYHSTSASNQTPERDLCLKKPVDKSTKLVS